MAPLRGVAIAVIVCGAGVAAASPGVSGVRTSAAPAAAAAGAGATAGASAAGTATAAAGAAAAAVTGRVIDEAGRPVRGAAIAIDASADAGAAPDAPAAIATTDADGRFALGGAVPPGALLVVTKEGYATGLAAAGGGEAIVLLAEGRGAETIAVRGAPPPSAPGAARLGREVLERLPGTGNDVLRALSALPGVANHPLPLGATGVAIRGSAPQDSRLLIDGFEVPALYHDLGARSIVPAEAIDALEYVPGGFDASHGRAASGIVHLTTRAGAAAPAQQAELSAGELSALAQGPLARGRGRYLLALRRSTADLLLPLLLPDDIDLSFGKLPRFYDEQLRLDYAPSARWSLRVSSVGADDALEVYASRTPSPEKRLATRTRFARLTTAARYRAGAWSADAAVSGIAQQQVHERGRHQRLDAVARGLAARAEVTRTEARARSGLRDLVARAGAEAAVTAHAIDAALPAARREGEPPRPDDPRDTSTRFSGTATTRDAAAWAVLAGSLDDRLRLTTGLRVDAFARNRDVAVQPRAELAARLTPRLVARAAAGAYSRPPVHETELFDPSLRAERATQVVAGAAYEPAEGARAQVSLYYTDRRSLIARDAMTGALGNTGRGTSLGAELLATVERGPWLGWLAYAYSRSTRIDAPGTAPRLFDHDQPHHVTAAASYRARRWQLGVRFRAHSGMPATPIGGASFDSDANRYMPAYGAVNSARAPAHHQLDVRIDRHFRWGPVRMTKFIDVQNVYCNDTAIGYLYSFDYTQRGAFRTLPIVPTAGLRGEL